jgi:ABC-type multidrug transport system ATPase subunit
MATHTLEECEKIADRIMVLADGAVSVCGAPVALRRKFGCGYRIETEEANADVLGEVMRRHGRDAAVQVADGRATAVVSAEENGEIGAILKELPFKYLLAVQNLEEKVFAHIQAEEIAAVQRKEFVCEGDDEDCHPRV